MNLTNMAACQVTCGKVKQREKREGRKKQASSTLLACNNRYTYYSIQKQYTYINSDNNIMIIEGSADKYLYTNMIFQECI